MLCMPWLLPLSLMLRSDVHLFITLVMSRFILQSKDKLSLLEADHASEVDSQHSVSQLIKSRVIYLHLSLLRSLL